MTSEPSSRQRRSHNRYSATPAREVRHDKILKGHLADSYARHRVSRGARAARVITLCGAGPDTGCPF